MSNLDSLLGDVLAHKKRLKSGTDLNIQNELRYNLYPLIESVIREIAEIDEAVYELAEQAESYLDYGTASQLVQTLTLAAALMDAVAALELDELTKKKIDTLCGELNKNIELSMVAIQEATEDDGDTNDERDTDTDNEKEEGETSENLDTTEGDDSDDGGE